MNIFVQIYSNIFEYPNIPPTLPPPPLWTMSKTKPRFPFDGFPYPPISLKRLDQSYYYSENTAIDHLLTQSIHSRQPLIGVLLQYGRAASDVKEKGTLKGNYKNRKLFDEEMTKI